MIKAAFSQFPEYKNQIKSQMPQGAFDVEAPDEEDLDSEEMWLRIRKCVEVYNGVFNARETSLDRAQKLQKDQGSISQFLESDSDGQSKQKRKKDKKARNSGNQS